jgi:hypothetical protein
VGVYDSQIPSMVTYGDLSIIMTRNDNPPAFSENPYVRALEWRDVPGKIVVELTATDDDGVST